MNGELRAQGHLAIFASPGGGAGRWHALWLAWRSSRIGVINSRRINGGLSLRLGKRAKSFTRTACSTLLAIVMACPTYVARETAGGNGRQATPAHDPATIIKVPGVKGFAEVTPTLYRGEQPSEEGFENLAKMGVQIIVDLRLHSKASERKRVTALGMQSVDIPWFCMLPNDKDFAKFLLLIRDNPGKKIFVHCKTGDDRAGMEIAAFRMAEQGWSAQEARAEMVRSGANWLHQLVCPGLGSYEKKFPERYRTRPAFERLRTGDPATEPNGF
jgi:protein-tyrosine phosphatase